MSQRADPLTGQSPSIMHRHDQQRFDMFNGNSYPHGIRRERERESCNTVHMHGALWGKADLEDIVQDREDLIQSVPPAQKPTGSRNPICAPERFARSKPWKTMAGSSAQRMPPNSRLPLRERTFSPRIVLSWHSLPTSSAATSLRRHPPR